MKSYGVQIPVSGDWLMSVWMDDAIHRFIEAGINGMLRDLAGEPKYGPPAPPKYGPPEPDWCSECGETPYPRERPRKTPPHLAMLPLGGSGALLRPIPPEPVLGDEL